MKAIGPETPRTDSSSFNWVTFATCALVSLAGWAAWSEIFDDAVTAWGFGLTLLPLPIWAASRETYPLALILGTGSGLIVSFVLLYTGESLLWVVGLQMVLLAALAPIALIFLVSRIVLAKSANRR